MASSYTQQGGGFVATNEYVALQYQAYPTGIMYAPMFGTAALTVSDAQDFPLDAIVQNASFDITARAPVSRVPFNEVGEITVRDAAPILVRGADGTLVQDAVVVDFGSLTTVQNISPGSGVRVLGVHMWTGTDWKLNSASQAEFASQRVLLEFDESVSAIDVESNGSVMLPAAPTGIELLLDGIVVWTDRQGGDAIANGWRVNRTDVVRLALTRLKAASAVGDASVSLRVELRADVLADLKVIPKIEISRVHRVVFPNGPTRTIDNLAEGLVAVSLPLPDAATSWSVDMVQVRAAASVGPERVQPARGPIFTDDATLGLKRGRSVMLRLPDILTSRFATITGIRIPIIAEGSEGEIGGQILGVRADLSGPGAPIEGATLTPVSVPSGEVPAWTTLELSVDLDVSEGPFWVELIVSYGDLVYALTHSGDLDPIAPGAVIHRRLPGGGSRPLTSFDSEEIAPLFGPVRIVGEAGPNNPIDALLLNLEDPSSGDLDESVEIGVTPISGGVAMYLKLPSPAVPVSGSLQLVGATAVGGVFTFDEIDVIYQEVEI